jgi:pyruvate/2-oxoglutarate dehydrogenase complex dihydrolipoamide acyltransferase (E2) component
LLINSRYSVIPAAPHLERKVLIGTDRICSEVRSLLAISSSARGLPDRNSSLDFPYSPEIERKPERGGQYVDVVIPKLNSNDNAYVLLSWLTGNGDQVRADDAIAEIETSKAVEELAAPASGVMLHGCAPGTECHPGDSIARLMVTSNTATSAAKIEGANVKGDVPDSGCAMRTKRLSRNQLFVADTVSTSHREIPDAFVVVQAEIDPVLRLQRAALEDESQEVGLLETLVMAVAALKEEYQSCFSRLVDAKTVSLPDGAHVGVTLDAGNGLFIPVVRSAESRSSQEVADLLAAFRLKAVRANFTENDLAAPNIAISWNYDSGVSLVKAVIPPGLACVVSVGGPRSELDLAESGRPARKTVVSLGLAHDHRIVNGREAAAFLREIAAILRNESRLKELHQC